MEKRILKVTDYIGERLDKYLSVCFEDISRSCAQKLITENKVTVNEKNPDKKYIVKSGDSIEVIFEEPKELDVKEENIPLDIVYEDEFLLVVNKPQGMVVHPAAGNYDKTLVNALLYHCKGSLSGINGVIRPGIVHRIDKNTSGLLIVAKNDFAHARLSKQIKEHSFTREYEAIVCGHFKTPEGTVDAPIGRHKTDRKKMSVTMLNSRNAVTHYKVIEELPKYTHVRCILETGRTHQIRVHMAYLGHPVLGDEVYGSKTNQFKLIGQCLHAKKIGFVHPSTGEYMEFESPLPEYFQKVLHLIKKELS